MGQDIWAAMRQDAEDVLGNSEQAKNLLDELDAALEKANRAIARAKAYQRGGAVLKSQEKPDIMAALFGKPDPRGRTWLWDILREDGHKSTR